MEPVSCYLYTGKCLDIYEQGEACVASAVLRCSSLEATGGPVQTLVQRDIFLTNFTDTAKRVTGS